MTDYKSGALVPAEWFTREHSYAGIIYNPMDEGPLPQPGDLVFPLWPMKAEGSDDWILPGVIQTVTSIVGAGTGEDRAYFFQGQHGQWRINTNNQPWRSATAILDRQSQTPEAGR